MTTKAEYKKLYELIFKNIKDAPKTLEIYLLSYLEDPAYQSKTVVLNAMTDNLYKFWDNNSELISACLKLMHSDYEDERNGAARVLCMGGEFSKKECYEELKFIKEEWASQIIGYISFSFNMGI